MYKNLIQDSVGQILDSDKLATNSGASMLQQLAVLFNLSGVLHFHHLIASRDNNICSFGFSKSAFSFPYSYSSSKRGLCSKISVL